jgi:hypothetical protein
VNEESFVTTLRSEIFLNRNDRAWIVFRCRAVTFADQVNGKNRTSERFEYRCFSFFQLLGGQLLFGSTP